MGLLDLFRNKQLDHIEANTNQITATLTRMETRMTNQEQALDAALGTLTDTVTAIRGGVDAIIAKLAGVEGVDLSDETAALEGLSASLQTAADQLTAATAPPPEAPPE